MDNQTTANDECGICLETLTAAVTLPCTHKFCADCLDGWKSKFGSVLKKERSKSCPLCREKIPPSKDMLIQLEFHRAQKRRYEKKGDTTSNKYWLNEEQIKELEVEIGDYEGKGLNYDDDECIELPDYIYDATVETTYIYNALDANNIKRIMNWLGSPVDKKRLRARYPGRLNYTLVHLAAYANKIDLMSMLLQYGADVNALDAKGWNPLMIASSYFELSKILLEWGAEISLPRPDFHAVQARIGSNRDAFIQYLLMTEETRKLANLVSSEFGGRRCEVINLPNHPQLNGKACVVEKYITKKDKYKIIFEGSGNAALVGPNNLKRRDRTPLDCGYYISFKNGRMSRREFATKEECQAYVSSLGGDADKTAEGLAGLKL